MWAGASRPGCRSTWSSGSCRDRRGRRNPRPHPPLREPDGGARAHAPHRAGGGLRAARPQRLRQDDDDPISVRAARADCGHRPGGGPRGDGSARPHQGADRVHVAEVRALRGSHRGREPRLLRRDLRPEGRRAARAHRRRGRVPGPRSPDGPARGPALGRMEAAPGARLRPHAPARALVPRRAHRRRRPRRPAQLLAHDSPAGPRGDDRDRHHALHGRSRAVRSPGDDEPGTPDRPGHARRGRGAGRRGEPRRRLRHPAGARRGAKTRFWPMFRKEFIQMRRDRLTLAIMIGIPVLQLLLFGYAIQTDVRNIPTVVLDESRSPESRELIAAFQNTGNFLIVAQLDGRAALDHAIASGDAQAGIVVPNDYPRDLARGRTATVQVIVDASDPLSSQAAIQAAAGVAQVKNLLILGAAAGRATLPLDARVRPRYNPGLRSPNYIVPGLVGVILTIPMVLITAMAIVRERERGTLEQLIVTPITNTELMLGKIAPYIGVGLIQMSAVLLLGRFVFDVPLSGNVLLLYGIALIFVVASLALGLFISTLVKTQQQAIQVAFFFVLPNILLSGFMFPRQAMPLFFQWISLLLPLTHFLKVLRGILLKGVGVMELWRELLILLAFAAGLIVLAVRRFRKTLD